QAMKPFALLLTNASDRALVAITLRWTFILPNEEPVVMQSRAESFVLGVPSSMATFEVPLPRRPPPAPGASASGSIQIPTPQSGAGHMPLRRPRMGASESSIKPLAPGQTMLVAPGTFMTPQAAGGGASGSGDHEIYATATGLTVMVDSVVLEDGQVL